MTALINFKTISHFFCDHGFKTDLIPDLSDKTVIVTGANIGLGYETALALGSKGAHVFLACRSRSKAEEAIEKMTSTIQKNFPEMKPRFEFLELDLNDIQKSDLAAKEFVKKGLPLHILVNNSGIMNTPFGLTVDGIEQQFGVNHLGHFVFTLGLLDTIKQSQPSRIVNLSSVGHHLFRVKGGINFDDLNTEGKRTNMQRYGVSKLSNVLFTKALARRLANENVLVNCCHPGGVNTNLMQHTKGRVASWMMDNLGAYLLATPAYGALTTLFLASSPEVSEKDYRGQYFVPTANLMDPNPDALNEELQEQLWDFSLKIMNEKLKN